ncbi:MAG TPA: type 4a pilus biogenesis protein PilO, partial [Candidatus Bathyarchaeia archaeon]|nr:type 4a pilus biogenesis protein PilO [Candidatus Bathyarchaeia archaeon]
AASSADVPPAYVCANVPVGAAPQASVPGQTQTTGSLAGASASPALPFPADCLNTVGISMKAAGSWEQILDFFKYLEDMNRISNVEKITLSTDQASAQAQPSSDLLTANISAKAFFKGKNPAGNSLLSQSLASQGNFNQKALDKMKEVIYAAYDVPAVSPSAERNIFK